VPIREENKARYPKDWKAISLRIREKAGQKCEKCAAPNGQEILRMTCEDYHFEPVYAIRTGEIFCANTGREIDYRNAPDLYGKWVKVVLTVAHLDHTPENCADDNLKAWCQRCHNIYDMPMRKAGIAIRAKSGLASGDLFGGREK
jgi:hypothetical protein